MPKFSPIVLEEFAQSLLIAAGATAEEAARTAAGLVSANLRGYDSHGVMRLPYYVKALHDGAVVSGAEMTVINESTTHLAADANWGFGQVQAGRLLDVLTEKVKGSGMAVGTLRHCGHIGRLGEYCETAAERGLVSMVMVNSHGGTVRVAPPGGKAPRLSTNPMAIGVPHGEEPLVLDFSTSATAEGKVRVKRIAGEACPAGWLIDSEGRPTTDPALLYGDPPGSILPLGGAQSYKGFGLGLMIEILTGALSGGACVKDPLYPKIGNCVLMLLLDPQAFGGGSHFAGEVAALVAYQRACPRIDGVERIVMPGDPERTLLAERRESGLSFDAENWRQLTVLAEELGVLPPTAAE